MKFYSKIRIPIPVTSDNIILSGGINTDGYLGGNPEDIFNYSKHLKDFYNLLIKNDPIGRIGNYKGVFYLTVGIESFTPDIGSNPGNSIIGEMESVYVLFFETYFNPKEVQQDKIDTFLKEAILIHPRETPVIEIIENSKIYF